MKCISCNIMWSDPDYNYKLKDCPFCKATLPIDREIRNDYLKNGFDISKNELLRYVGEGGDIVIPESVTIIGYGAFSYCRNLNSIVLPKNLTVVGDWSFYECSNLTSITLPTSLVDIGESAFLRCKSLTNVTIPNSLTNIGGNAFSLCESLPCDFLEQIKMINPSCIK